MDGDDVDFKENNKSNLNFSTLYLNHSIGTHSSKIEENENFGKFKN